MQIYGPTHVHGAQGVKGPHANRPAAPQQPTRTQAASDQLDISPAAEAAVQAAEDGGIRADLVARVKGEIASGTYETPEKLDAAFDRFLDQLV